MDANAARGLTDASAEFKQLGAQSFDLYGTPGLRQLKPKEVHQIVGAAMQEQAEGIWPKSGDNLTGPRGSRS